MGFFAASLLAAGPAPGSAADVLLVPVVTAASLVGIALSTLMFRTDAAGLSNPFDRVERAPDAMAFGRLPEESLDVEPGSLQNLSEAVAGLLYRLRGLDEAVHGGTSRLRVPLSDLSPDAQAEANAILARIRELTPTRGATAAEVLPCWLVAEAPAPLSSRGDARRSSLDLLRLDDPAEPLDAGPAWELRATSADTLVAA